MKDIMDIIFTMHREKQLDTVEKYHIYQKQNKKAYKLMTKVLLLEIKYLM